MDGHHSSNHVETFASIASGALPCGAPRSPGAPSEWWCFVADMEHGGAAAAAAGFRTEAAPRGSQVSRCSQLRGFEIKASMREQKHTD